LENSGHHDPKSAPVLKLFLKEKVKLIPSPIFGLTSPLFEFHLESWGVLWIADFRG